MEDQSVYRRWDELIPDALGLIFANLSLQEKLTVVPRVCKSWCRAVSGPYCWQEIDIDEWSKGCKPDYIDRMPDYIDRMLHMLIMRSCGSLRKLCVSGLYSDASFTFLAEHTGSLQTLRLTSSEISDSIVEQISGRLSTVTFLDLSYCDKIGARAFEAIGKHCKLLVGLCRNMYPMDGDKCTQEDEANAIATTMPKLKRLEIAYLRISTDGVLKILSGCPELEYLDLKGCLHLTRSEISDSIVEQISRRLSTVTFLDLSFCDKIGARALEAIGKHCKLLVGLCRNMYPYGDKSTQEDEANAIATMMPMLKRLEIAYLRISTDCVLKILSGCPELEYLDLKGCLRLTRSEISDSIVEQISGRLSTVTFLDLSYCDKIGARAFEAIGKHCKLLVGLCWNMYPLMDGDESTQEDEANAIATMMPKLKRLEIAYLRISTDGVLKILSGCPELEYLDLRGCWEVELDISFLMEKFPKLKTLGPLVKDVYEMDWDSDSYSSEYLPWEFFTGDIGEYNDDDSLDELWDDERRLEELELRFYEEMEDACLDRLFGWHPSP